MGVNHRPANIAVPEQLLDGPDIVSIFQQSRRERNDATNEMLQALLSPRCEQLLERLFVAVIREDDACSIVRLRGHRALSMIVR